MDWNGRDGMGLKIYVMIAGGGRRGVEIGGGSKVRGGGSRMSLQMA